MANFQSRKFIANASSETVFKNLTDFRNFDRYMAGSGLKNWKAEVDSCQFSLEFMGETKMRFEEKIQFSKIKIQGSGKVNFEMIVHINTINSNSCEGIVELSAELNFFIKSIAEKPITNFLNIISEKITEHHK